MKHELGIMIDKPQVNDDHFKRYSWDHRDLGKTIVERLRRFDVSPSTHPRVADICAGYGSMARILAQKGWTEITCFDRETTSQPFWKGDWQYMDLAELGTAVRVGYSLPPPVEGFRGKFDLVVATQAEIGTWRLAEVCHFFTKLQGVAVPDAYCREVDENSKRWERLSPVLYRKIA